MTTTLAIDGLCVSFRAGVRTATALRGVSLSLDGAECLGIVGESGSGKTVLALAIMGLLPRGARLGGSIRFEGREILGLPARALNPVRGSRLAMIFQDPMTALTPHLKIGVQLAEVLVTHRGVSWREAEQAALNVLERVRVPDAGRRLRQYPHQLSGGMRQRVMIGMSLLCEPSVLLADEPTTALDVTVQAEVIDLLKSMREEFRMATVLISHDMGVVAGLAERILVMYAGRIVESAPSARLLQRATHPYTAGLLNCVPSLHAPRLARMPTLAGAAPSATDADPGCAFAPRCVRVRERCRSERPVLHEPQQTGHAVACHFPIAP